MASALLEFSAPIPSFREYFNGGLVARTIELLSVESKRSDLIVGPIKRLYYFSKLHSFPAVRFQLTS